LPVTVVCKPIRYVYLRIMPPDGEVRVSAPFGLPDEAIRSLVARKRGWIMHHRRRLAARPAAPAAFDPALLAACRRRLLLLVPPMIKRWQRVIGVEVTAWRVRRMRTLWGSCNVHARRILLSPELARTPERCLEYVVVHELVHLLEPRHNDRFWALMDRFMPDWGQRRDELHGTPAAST